MLRRLFSSIGSLSRRRNLESETDDELRFHIEMETEANRARGLSLEDARRKALSDLGGVTQTREAVREVRAWWIDGALQDLRFAFRRWRHRPGFAGAAILTVGLGIASATSIFSVVDAVLLRPLPWAKPESLVIVHGVFPERRNRWYLSLNAWDALRSASSFEAVGVWHAAWASDTTVGDRGDELVAALNVSSALLPMLGVKLERGRFFSQSEDHFSRSDSLILTDEFWRRRFGARDDIIGQRVTLTQARLSAERISKTVIGVIAPGFQFGGIRPEILRPIGESWWARDSDDFRIVARLAPGVSLDGADAQAAALVSASPIDHQSASARLVPIEDEQLGSSRRPLWMLFGGAGILMLIACSNVAGLLFGEARVRRHEFAVRAAIGGSRRQVLRQLVVENGLLAIAGVAVGLVGARWLTSLVVAAAPAGMPRIETATMDIRTALFAMVAGLVTLLIFGIAPALVLARAPVATALGSEGRHSRGKVTGQRLVVAAQVALALVLLTGATLFGETILRLRAQPLGFHPEGVAVVSTTFTGSKFGGDAAIRAALKSAGKNANPDVVLVSLQRATTAVRTEAVFGRLTSIPGVTKVAATSAPPFVANPEPVQIVLEGRPRTERLDVSRQVVTDGYFSTMGMGILTGRDFATTDAGDPPVAIVSAEFEKRFFPAGALNRRFTLGPPTVQTVPYQIIGVVPDVKRLEPADDVRPAFYYYHRQGSTPNHFVLLTSGDPSALLAAARRAVNDVSREFVVTSTTTMASNVARSIVEERFRATLSVVFGAVALVLAAVGLYGLAACRVVDRRREFAVRVALGARPTDVRRLVIRDAVAIVFIGFAVGLPASFAVAQITNSLLFGVQPTSAHVFAFAGLLLGIVVTIATMLPARRAGRVNPVDALKE